MRVLTRCDYGVASSPSGRALAARPGLGSAHRLPDECADLRLAAVPQGATARRWRCSTGPSRSRISWAGHTTRSSHVRRGRPPCRTRPLAARHSAARRDRHVSEKSNQLNELRQPGRHRRPDVQRHHRQPAHRVCIRRGIRPRSIAVEGLARNVRSKEKMIYVKRRPSVSWCKACAVRKARLRSSSEGHPSSSG